MRSARKKPSSSLQMAVRKHPRQKRGICNASVAHATAHREERAFERARARVSFVVVAEVELAASGTKEAFAYPCERARVPRLESRAPLNWRCERVGRQGVERRIVAAKPRGDSGSRDSREGPHGNRSGGVRGGGRKPNAEKNAPFDGRRLGSSMRRLFTGLACEAA